MCMKNTFYVVILRHSAMFIVEVIKCVECTFPDHTSSSDSDLNVVVGRTYRSNQIKPCWLEHLFFLGL